MSDHNVLDYQAVADGLADDAPALQRAIDAAHAAGGGRVVVPAGSRVRAGSFELRSRVELHVARGAVLVSATTLEAFPRRVFDSGDEADKRLWIGASHAEDITLSGTGVIDGQCHAFALGQNEHIYTPTLKWRPALTCFEDVRRLVVRDLTFRNAANWTLHFTGCQDVSVHDVKIFNDLRFPNADGIDPDHCQRVNIARCHIVSADDCIVLKNTAQFTRYGPCEDIDVSDCRLESVSAAFKIGSESHGDFRRIRVRDCVIERSHRGLAFQLRDGGSVEDVEFRNITVNTRRFAPVFWGAGEALYVTALARLPGGPVSELHNIRFHDIRCSGENGVVIYSQVPGRIHDVLLERVHVEILRTTPWPSGLLDLRPCPPGYLPPGASPADVSTPWGQPALRPPSMFSVEGATHVELREVTASASTRDDFSWAWLTADHPTRGQVLDSSTGQIPPRPSPFSASLDPASLTPSS